MMALPPFSFTHELEYFLHAGNFAVRKMCGNGLNLVNSFSVMLGWVEQALSKKGLCLLVLLLITFANSLDPDQALTKRLT